MRQSRKIQPQLQENWLELEHARELRKISEILESEPRIRELILHDLQEASGATEATGASGMSAAQVLRALVIKQINGFSYRELAFHLADSRTYRAFCRLGIDGSSPSKSTLQSNIKAIRAATLRQVNQILLEVAVAEGVEDGAKVRFDTTGVESDIHHPTDSGLLWDSVRVLVRLMGQAREILGADVVRFSDRTRRAKRRRKEINTASRKTQRKAPYRDLLKVTAEVYGDAVSVREVLEGNYGIGSAERAVLVGIAEQLDHFLPLVQRVMGQTRQRVLDGERVPAADKIVSIFEPHADIIAKGGREITYGHKVCLAAGRSSMVLDCDVLDGNPPDSTLAVDLVQRQIELYGASPRQVAFDGAFASKCNLEQIKDHGVQDVAFAKRVGLEISDMASSSWIYQRLRKFRAGIEGIVSFLKRAFGMGRCPWRTLPSFRSYVWSSVVACNLMVLARHLL